MTQAQPDAADDPALTGNFSEQWARHIEANDARPLPKLGHTPHPHTVLVKQTVDALKKLPGQKRVRKRPVGRFIVTDGNGNPRKQNGKWIYVRVAVSGDPDIELLWTPPGRTAPIAVMLEAKTGKADLNEDQKEARDEALAMGAAHIVVRSAAQAFEDVMSIARPPNHSQRLIP